MKSHRFLLSVGLIIVLSFAGFAIGYKKGHKKGSEIGKDQEIKRINEELWERSLDIDSKTFDDSELVIIRHFMRRGDTYKDKVGMKAQAEQPGLTVKVIYSSSAVRMGGVFLIQYGNSETHQICL